MENDLCDHWWSEPVKAIYRQAITDLGGDYDPLEFGPGHIVWSDGNFEDEHIQFCLEECETRRAEFEAKYDVKSLAIVKRSLEQLLAIPEDERGDDPYCE